MKKITLYCPICKKTRKIVPHRTDPVGTDRIVMSCPKCNEGESYDVGYFDKDGKQLLVPLAKQCHINASLKLESKKV